jgi:hypothetical protein
LFRHTENHIRVVEALAQKGGGLSREEVIASSSVAEGGALTKVLRELEYSGFVREYSTYGKKSKGRMYQIIDPFVLFHLRFSPKQATFSEDFWLRYHTAPTHSAWAGIAFEKLCLLHVPQIRKALGISGVLTEVYSWRSRTRESGAQIDLAIDRSDSIINFCEAKYSSTEFALDKKGAAALRNKRAAFTEETRTRKAANTTLITTYGLKHNASAAEIPFQLTLDDLFEARGLLKYSVIVRTGRRGVEIFRHCERSKAIASPAPSCHRLPFWVTTIRQRRLPAPAHPDGRMASISIFAKLVSILWR